VNERVLINRKCRREISNFIRDPRRDTPVLLNIVNVNIYILLFPHRDFTPRKLIIRFVRYMFYTQKQ